MCGEVAILVIVFDPLMAPCAVKSANEFHPTLARVQLTAIL
jgi:hypothetical protein